MRLKLKSIDPLQMGQKKTANLSVGGKHEIISICFFLLLHSDLAGCSLAMCGAVKALPQ